MAWTLTRIVIIVVVGVVVAVVVVVVVVDVVVAVFDAVGAALPPENQYVRAFPDGHLQCQHLCIKFSHLGRVFSLFGGSLCTGRCALDRFVQILMHYAQQRFRVPMVAWCLCLFPCILGGEGFWSSMFAVLGPRRFRGTAASSMDRSWRCASNSQRLLQRVV